MQVELETIISLIIGLLFCFFGYRIQKVVISLVWFIIGYRLANFIAPNFIGDQTTILIISIVVGLILLSIGYKLEKLAIFITVSYLVYTTIAPYIGLLNQSSNISLLIQAGASLIIGALSVIYIKYILIFITSIAGANLITEIIPTFISLNSTIILIIFIVLSLLGILFQFKNN